MLGDANAIATAPIIALNRHQKLSLAVSSSILDRLSEFEPFFG